MATEITHVQRGNRTPGLLSIWPDKIAPGSILDRDILRAVGA